MRTLRPVPIAPWIFLDSSLRPERLPGVVRPYGARSTHGAAVAVDTRACGSNHGSMAWINGRSEEHTSELQSLMRISYAVFCLKKTTTTTSQIILTAIRKH